MYVIRDKLKYRAKVRTKSQLGNTGFTDGLQYYNKKAQGYLREADYYSQNKKYDKANTYTKWANEASDKARLQMKWANEARVKARLRMKWAQEAMDKARK